MENLLALHEVSTNDLSSFPSVNYNKLLLTSILTEIWRFFLKSQKKSRKIAIRLKVPKESFELNYRYLYEINNLYNYLTNLQYLKLRKVKTHLLRFLLSKILLQPSVRNIGFV